MRHKIKNRKDISIEFCNFALLLTSHLPQLQIVLFLEPHIAGGKIANMMQKLKWEEKLILALELRAAKEIHLGGTDNRKTLEKVP